ncbi:hypothetical protein [Agreia bicolorata]|nr:hypothetical protein [Agreia bicolorata]
MLINAYSSEPGESGLYGNEASAQLRTYGLAVCEWFSEADMGAIDAVEAESQAIVAWSKRHSKNKPPVSPELLATRYREALDRYFGSS